MASNRIKFLVKANTNKEELILVGNVEQLGSWNPEKGIKLTFCDECGMFTATKMLPSKEVVEFKVLEAADWSNVEKGSYGEDVANHAFVVEKGTTVEIEVSRF